MKGFNRNKVILVSWVIIGICISSISFGSSEEGQIIESFKAALTQYFNSYKVDKRERVALLGGGWVEERYSPSEKYKIDVQRTNSLISPYIATCEFTLIRERSVFHSSRDEAEKDNSFVKSDKILHRHTYAYQSDKWVVTKRQHQGYKGWYDCNEVIPIGENAGAKNIYGCWESTMDSNFE